MQEIIKKLQKAYMESTNQDDRFKLRAALCKLSGTSDRMCDKEVAQRVAREYSLDKQIEIILSGNIVDITKLKEYRAKIRKEVENEMEQSESMLSEFSETEE